jgi:hypothetical protein
VKFEDYERHINYCGSKTKKCPVCSHNVCLKDEDMHTLGGECQAFIEEDRKKREMDQEKKRREELKKAEENKRKIDERER